MNAPAPATPSPGPAGAPRPAGPAAPQRVRSDELLGTRGEVEIEHAGSVYRLRRTAQGKLILTK